MEVYVRYDMVSPIVYVQRDGVAAAVKSGLCVKIGALMMGNAVLTQTPAYSQPANARKDTLGFGVKPRRSSRRIKSRVQRLIRQQLSLAFS